MKKIIIILFLITSFIINSKTISAFGVDLEGGGFYSNIADSISKMETDLYKIDIVGKDGIKEKINKIIGSDCVKENLSIDEINNIVNNGNLSTIINKIDESCKNEDGDITNDLLISLINGVNVLKEEYSKQAKEKTNQVYDLGSTGIYADGIDANAPFDLITDLNNIDSIIFSEESTIYEGNMDFDLDGEISSLISESDNINKMDSDIFIPKIINGNNNSNDIYNNLKNFDTVNSNNIYSNFLCSVDNSNSELNENSLLFLNSDVKLNNLNSSTPYSKTGSLSNSGTINKAEMTKAAIDNPESDYSKVTDNSQFPCSTFFCIDIQFITYEHQLLGGGFQDISIEYLINRSNDHLKKFTNTSSIGSEMTLNNFELGLKDLNLSDIFHIGIQVTKKPVPILNIEKENKEDDGVFSTENQLKFYYESYGLEYKRRNDLSIFKKVDADKQIALNSGMLPTTNFLNKVSDFNNYQKETLKQKDVMNKLISNKTKVGIISDFELQFKELESFNGSIKDYIFNLDKLISNMSKIPQS